jgi:putative DNA primase/helicase
MDRSIVLELRRKLPGESVEKLRRADAHMFDILKAKLARFAQDFVEKIRDIKPELPEELNDRAQDNWEPLLAIATLADQKWSAKARNAALTLSGDQTSATSIGTELLADIKVVFMKKKTSAISTAELITALCRDEEKCWGTYNRGNPIGARQVARILNLYGIASKTIRISPGRTAKGYRAESFTEAFKRYLPPTQT